MRHFFLLLPFLALVLLSPSSTDGQDKKKRPPAKPQTATDPTTLKVAKGFKVELLYSVPKETEGSWVNLCVDPKGRLITSDQYGPLYRVTLPPLGSTEGLKVEKLPADVGDAQGMLWAFDALYVMSNSRRKLPSGTQLKPALYRVTSSKKDDVLDKVEMLLEFQGAGGEHGTHAILPHPDGKRLTLVCGNQTDLPKYDTTKVPPIWGDDHLLPRLPDGNGFMKGRLAPGGFMLNVDPNGKNAELFSVGFRNQFDAAYNRDGELFSYDADMEWDMNTPWYRPTRVCLVTSGSEFGWRNGAGKYPAYYPDNLPGICDIGPGSPTGVTFGYGAKFPAKYQNAFFICDWSYGKMYAVHLKDRGLSGPMAYAAQAEEFITGTPLPLTDVVINPHDGAMYFAIGGRKTQGGLYRVTYVGPDDEKKPGEKTLVAGTGVSIQDRLETLAKLQGEKLDEQRLKAIVPFMGRTIGDDRFFRFSLRTILESHDPKLWAEAALSEADPQASIHALLALVRVSASCPDHDPKRAHGGDPALRGKILASLGKIDFTKLTHEQKLDMIRVYHVLFHRFGPPTADEKTAWLAKFDPVFPTKNRYVDSELLQVYVYLDAPKAGELGMKLLTNAPTQEEQMEYGRALRVLKTGWTPELQKQYAQWLVSANTFRGGNSLRGFMTLIRQDFETTLKADEKTALNTLLKEAAAGPKVGVTGPARAVVKKWTLEELAPKLEAGLKGGRDFDRGRKLFGEARCFGCHRYDNDGSAFGPDLSGVAGRFSQKDLLESIIDPSKEVSDQYAAVQIELEDGGQVFGRIVNLHDDNISVNTDMLDPNAMKTVKRNNIAKMKPSKTSMMPTGLLDTLKEDEALDLLAYLLSRGDRENAMFKK
ncbi:c-type cytochrome [Limnoglobus roseus]|uniref:Putative beta-propeller-type glycoside hydrolase n=1 Tax=Limnoglobus roseus TaxID=2598579 RepID=A0A5C1APN1_9BACT|nr:c-type cytochrome [Limnoglobus roseus]QEL20107.1 putative beta-propeller-type glycoside hydrolase [Limnoglobus roseus]